MATAWRLLPRQQHKLQNGDSPIAAARLQAYRGTASPRPVYKLQKRDGLAAARLQASQTAKVDNAARYLLLTKLNREPLVFSESLNQAHGGLWQAAACRGRQWPAQQAAKLVRGMLPRGVAVAA